MTLSRSVRTTIQLFGIAAVVAHFCGGCSSATEPSQLATPILYSSYPDPQTTPHLALISADGRRVESPARFANAAGADWAPDGRRIVFERIVAGRSQIFVGPLDGSTTPVQITQCPVNCYSPRWSPDGARIAYWSGYPSMFAPTASDSGVTIVSDTTGANAREVTATRANVQGFSGCPAAWAPDGTRFAFSRPDGSLYTVGLDGSPAVQVPLTVLVGAPAWSPDGTRIAVTISGQGLGIVDIAAAPPGLPIDPRRIDLDHEYIDLAWSPDGQHIAFAAYAAQGVHIGIIDSDGTGHLDLMAPTDKSLNYGPRWNPTSP